MRSKNREKRRHIYDDHTIDNLKKYYQIDNHDELLKFVKRHRIHDEDNDYEVALANSTDSSGSNNNK